MWADDAEAAERQQGIRRDCGRVRIANALQVPTAPDTQHQPLVSRIRLPLGRVGGGGNELANQSES